MGKRARAYVQVVWAIFVRDLKRFLRNPVALVLILGACALPSAYAWLCTAANWDPYQSTQGIRIAVANEDEGADTEAAGRLDVGAQVVEKLKANHELGWTFYDSGVEALDSVASGESFAAIVIPKTFSEDFASILTGHFVQPTIDYYLNEKVSAAAPDFTNEGIQVVRQEIDQTFSDTVLRDVLVAAQKVEKEAKSDADQAQNALAADVAKAGDALAKARESFSSMTPALEAAQQAAQGADETLQGLESVLADADDLALKTRDALGSARDAASSLGDSASSALSAGADDVRTASGELLLALAQLSARVTATEGEVSAALAQAKGAVIQVKDIAASLGSLASGHPELTESLDLLNQAIDALDTTIAAAEQANTDTADALQGVDANLESLAATADAGATDAHKQAADLRDTIMPAVTKSLDDYAEASGSLSGLMQALEPATSQARVALDTLTQTLEQAKTTVAQAVASLEDVEQGLKVAQADLTSLQSADALDNLESFLKLTPDEASSFIAAPVELQTTALYPVKNYGSGVVSFFTSVALWVAGFVFIDLLKMRVDPAGLPRFTDRQAYWARWLLFMTFGLLPPLIVCTGDLLLGIQCESPVAFIGAGLVAGLVYVNVIYALAHAFRYVGKGLAVVFLIVQIPGSSGLYPVEMMPKFYQALNPLMPFTYAIDAFREAVGGFYGFNYLIDLLVLVLIFFPVGLFIGLVLGPAASHLTLLLDQEIERSGLFDGERVPAGMRLRSPIILRALLRTPEFHERVSRRMAWLTKSYPRLKLAGWIALAAQFVITFALMILVKADVDVKLILLAVMVAGIVVVDTLLVVLVYLHANAVEEERLAGLSPDDLAEVARKALSGTRLATVADVEQSADARPSSPSKEVTS